MPLLQCYRVVAFDFRGQILSISSSPDNVGFRAVRPPRFLSARPFFRTDLVYTIPHEWLEQSQ